MDRNNNPKSSKRNLFVASAMLATLLIPLSFSTASANIDDAKFGIIAIDKASPEFFGTAGWRSSKDGGSTPEPTPTPTPTPTPEPEPDPIGLFRFNIDVAECTTPSLKLYGLGEGATLTHYGPTGNTVIPAVEGVNPVANTGAWAVKGTFDKIGDVSEPGKQSGVAESGCLISVDEWVDTGTTQATFQDSVNLVSVVQPPATVTHMDTMFGNTGPKMNWESIRNWDVSNVQSMNFMFELAKPFTGAQIEGWNTSSLTSMAGMFAKTDFNGAIGNWNVSNVTNMSRLFYDAPKFNQPLNGWDTNKLKNAESMFMGASLFDQNLSTWVTSSITNMKQMFLHAAGFHAYGLSGWDTSNVTDMSEMFAYTPINSSIANWNTVNVTTMAGMFSRSDFNGNLTSWNVRNVTDMSQMFYYSKFTGASSISGWNPFNVTDMSQMFQGTAFNSFNLNWDIRKVANMSGMFHDNLDFKGDLRNWRACKTPSLPENFFDSRNPIPTANLPRWGKC